MTHTSLSLKPRQVLASFPEGRERLKLDLAQPCVPIAAGGHFALLSERGTMDGGFAGYFVHETRMLDRLTILVDGKPLRLRSFTTDVFQARYIYTNEDQTLLVERDVVIDSGVAERLKLTAFTDAPQKGPQEWRVTVEFSADFRAMGEVRDFGPTGRGNLLVPIVRERAVTFGWEGEDMLRTTTVRFASKPDLLDAQHAEFAVRLDVGQSAQIEYAVGCRVGRHRYRRSPSFASALASAKKKYADFIHAVPSITTGSPEFNNLLKESIDGLYMLIYRDDNDQQLMAAGLPWYFCLFTRDICIWILQCGWLFPELAQQVLLSLAYYQADWFEEETEAVPGQLPHEMRRDQLGQMKQTVFHHCCWAVDTAPLFVVAACEMAKWTGDRSFVEKIYDHLKRADRCMEHHTREDFIVFSSERRTNKFWMEEPCSITDEHGVVPPSPKAVCDIQGFAWQARILLADLAESLGEVEYAGQKREQAERFRVAFQRDFWDEEMQYPLIAIGGIGGQRHPCRVYHTDALMLPKGFLSEEQELAVARRAAQPDLTTPWGILPLSSKGRVFQPFFIQSQCVCPFQTVLGGVAWFMRNGMPDTAAVLMKGLADARQRLGHLPELYVVPSHLVGPLLYAATQMACYPQLWTAGAPLHGMKLCCGIAAGADELVIDQPSIPAFMRFVQIRGLRIQGAVVDLDYKRQGGKTTAKSKVRAGNLQVRRNG